MISQIIFFKKYKLLRIYIQKDQMEDAQLEATQKVTEIIAKVHHKLSKNFDVVVQARDLQVDENNILSQLKKDSHSYQNLVGMLAIETYVSALVEHNKKFQDIESIITMLLENLIKLAKQTKKIENQDLSKALNQLSRCAVQLVDGCHAFSPSSQYNEINRKIISVHQQQIPNYSQQYILNLREQIIELKQQINQKFKKVNDLEQQLTNLLDQHGLENDKSQTQSLLKMRIFQRQQQITRMNEEFTYEIQKYNRVFESMKLQLEELRSYSDMDLISRIQRLEIQIVKLREQKIRDQILTENLKKRLQFYEKPSRIYESRTRLARNRQYYHQQYDRKPLGKESRSYQPY